MTQSGTPHSQTRFVLSFKFYIWFSDNAKTVWVSLFLSNIIPTETIILISSWQSLAEQFCIFCVHMNSCWRKLFSKLSKSTSHPFGNAKKVRRSEVKYSFSKVRKANLNNTVYRYLSKTFCNIYPWPPFFSLYSPA